MSASDYRKRKRKMRRERNKDEVRTLRLVFADFINNGHNLERFPIREYIALTPRGNFRYQTSSSRYMHLKEQVLPTDRVDLLS
ncbi:MAG: hypothetical protein ACFE8Z_07325 [Candidatus Hermodarchaeota archaeon]